MVNPWDPSQMLGVVLSNWGQVYVVVVESVKHMCDLDTTYNPIITCVMLLLN